MPTASLLLHDASTNQMQQELEALAVHTCTDCHGVTPLLDMNSAKARLLRKLRLVLGLSPLLHIDDLVAREPHGVILALQTSEPQSAAICARDAA